MKDRMLVIVFAVLIAASLIAAIGLPEAGSVGALLAPSHVVMDAGETMRVHCYGSQLNVNELNAHWWPSFHVDFNITCEYGDD